MANPLEAYVKLQLAMWEGWAKIMTDCCAACERAMRHHAEVFEHPRYARSHNVIPRGADWFDHYGKRQHDVNPERV